MGIGDAGHAELDRALRLSAQMLDAAQAGRWETMPALQAQCDALVRGEHPADEATRSALQTLQERHLKLLELAGSARDAIGHDLGRHRHNHRALSAYLGSSQPG